MLIDAPDLSKREKRVFSMLFFNYLFRRQFFLLFIFAEVEDIAPTALEMGIDAMNLSHPVTLPFTAAKAESIADEQTIRNNQKKQHFKENELLFFQFPSIMPFANEVVDKKEEKPKEDPGHMRYDNGFANTLQHIKGIFSFLLFDSLAQYCYNSIFRRKNWKNVYPKIGKS